MQVSTLILLGLAIAFANSNSVSSFARNRSENEPRIFFRQMLEASGIFPIEVNVPDTISSMMSGMMYMYQTMSSYFGGSEGGGGGEQGQPSQDVYDEVDLNSRPISEKQRRKKVKKLKKKTSSKHDDDDEEGNLLDLFGFLMF